jgi:predicted transcriptional regulator
MATYKNNNTETMRACSVRLPQTLHAHLQQEAEKQGTTVGDVMRDALVRFRAQQALDEQLVQLEARFVRRVFESHCAVAGLTASEREEALRDLKQRMQGGQV